MTEAEWQVCTDPMAMLNYAAGRVGARQARLVRVAAARLIWEEFTDSQLRAAVEAAERHADGQITDEELAAHSHGLYGMWAEGGPHYRPEPPPAHLCCLAISCTHVAALSQRTFNGGANWSLAVRHLGGRLPPVLRYVLGNPFRPAPVLAELTPAAVSLAAGIYADRSFDRLPALADALEAAGCDAGVVGHCRDTGSHVRGCWAVDLVLGKGR